MKEQDFGQFESFDSGVRPSSEQILNILLGLPCADRYSYLLSIDHVEGYLEGYFIDGQTGTEPGNTPDERYERNKQEIMNDDVFSEEEKLEVIHDADILRQIETLVINDPETAGKIKEALEREYPLHSPDSEACDQENDDNDEDDGDDGDDDDEDDGDDGDDDDEDESMLFEYDGEEGGYKGYGSDFETYHDHERRVALGNYIAESGFDHLELYEDTNGYLEL